MSDRVAELEAALDRVATAARAHLAAIRAADGATDDDGVWSAYVALNNATVDYDELLHATYGEVTPWELTRITEEGDDDLLTSTLVSVPLDGGGDDPHPLVVSVRQRRDYRVPSVAALLRAAQESRPPLDGDEAEEPISTVADAVIELLQAGDGSLAMLDLPELEPLDGVVVVAEVEAPLRGDVFEDEPESAADAPFRLRESDRVVGRLHEAALSDDEE
jgi:hypothetical protein